MESEHLMSLHVKKMYNSNPNQGHRMRDMIVYTEYIMLDTGGIGIIVSIKGL